MGILILLCSGAFAGDRDEAWSDASRKLHSFVVAAGRPGSNTKHTRESVRTFVDSLSTREEILLFINNTWQYATPVPNDMKEELYREFLAKGDPSVQLLVLRCLPTAHLVKAFIPEIIASLKKSPDRLQYGILNKPRVWLTGEAARNKWLEEVVWLMAFEPDDRFFPILSTYTQHSDDAIRLSAAKAMHVWLSQRRTREMKQQLKDSNPKIRSVGLGALTIHNHGPGLIINVLADVDAGNRVVMLNRLQYEFTLRPQILTGRDGKKVMRIVFTMLEDKSTDVRLATLRLLRQLDRDVYLKHLAGMKNDPDENVRMLVKAMLEPKNARSRW